MQTTKYSVSLLENRQRCSIVVGASRAKERLFVIDGQTQQNFTI